MTWQETQDELLDMIYGPHPCKQKSLDENSDEKKERTREVVLNACIAVDKQIPTKPVLWGDGYANGELVIDSWDCPECGTTYEIEYDRYDYCPNCGQAIDWSET